MAKAGNSYYREEEAPPPGVWYLLWRYVGRNMTGFGSFLSACMPTNIPGSFHGLEETEGPPPGTEFLSPVVSYLSFILFLLRYGKDPLAKVKPNRLYYHICNKLMCFWWNYKKTAVFTPIWGRRMTTLQLWTVRSCQQPFCWVGCFPVLIGQASYHFFADTHRKKND